MSRVFRLPDMAAAEALQKKLTGRAAPSPARRLLHRPVASRTVENWALVLSRQIRSAGLPTPQLEYPFAKPERNYRADLAYPSSRLLIEVDGAVHRIKARFEADLERDQVIFFLGWAKLRVSPEQVRSGAALTLVERALVRFAAAPR